ncbi:MAG: hypothetical protein NWE84_05370 [Candidatus Bathyarchaeota archaeon]|nr:hypothetical protein [Candidatus Bathyarchaeota archaeon]
MKKLSDPPDNRECLNKSIETGATEIDPVSLASTRSFEVIFSASKEM